MTAETLIALANPHEHSRHGLTWTTRERRAPGRGEIEIAVAATGLNFRDVMWNLRLLPEEALEDGAPRGELRRHGEHVLVVLVSGIRAAAGSPHVRDRGQEFLGEEGREIAGGRGERPGKLRNFIQDDHVIDDEVIDAVTGPAT